MINYLHALIKLSENDKRVLIAVCLVFILLFVLIGYIVVIVKRIMRQQAKVVDNGMYDLVKTKIITTPRRFREVAFRKSNIYLFKKSFFPFLLLVVAVVLVTLYTTLTDKPNLAYLFDRDKGFGSLLFTFDWEQIPKSNFFGIAIPSDFPPLYSSPHLVMTWDAWVSYISLPLFFLGALWYMINVQAYIARFLRIMKMSKDVFTKDLDKLAGNLDDM